MTDRNKAGVAFWATVGLVLVLVGYPLSFGPACWINSWTGVGGKQIATIYRPIIGQVPKRMFGESPTVFTPAVKWYACVGAADGLRPYPSENEFAWAWPSNFTW